MSLLAWWRRRWVVVSVYTREDREVYRGTSRPMFWRLSAEAVADALNRSPEVLATIMATALRGPMIFVRYHAEEAPNGVSP